MFPRSGDIASGNQTQTRGDFLRKNGEAMREKARRVWGLR
jgi:hypothetical protein